MQSKIQYKKKLVKKQPKKTAKTNKIDEQNKIVRKNKTIKTNKNKNKNKNIININVNSNNKAKDKTSDIFIPPYLPQPSINHVNPPSQQNSNELLPLLFEYNNDKLTNRLMGFVDQRFLEMQSDVDNSISNNYNMMPTDDVDNRLKRKNPRRKVVNNSFGQNNLLVPLKEDNNKFLRKKQNVNLLSNPDEYDMAEVEIDNNNVNNDVLNYDTIASFGNTKLKHMPVNDSNAMSSHNRILNDNNPLTGLYTPNINPTLLQPPQVNNSLLQPSQVNNSLLQPPQVNNSLSQQPKKISFLEDLTKHQGDFFGRIKQKKIDEQKKQQDLAEQKKQQDLAEQKKQQDLADLKQSTENEKYDELVNKELTFPKAKTVDNVETIENLKHDQHKDKNLIINDKSFNDWNDGYTQEKFKQTQIKNENNFDNFTYDRRNSDSDLSNNSSLLYEDPVTGNDYYLKSSKDNSDVEIIENIKHDQHKDKNLIINNNDQPKKNYTVEEVKNFLEIMTYKNNDDFLSEYEKEMYDDMIGEKLKGNVTIGDAMIELMKKYKIDNTKSPDQGEIKEEIKRDGKKIKREQAMNFINMINDEKYDAKISKKSGRKLVTDDDFDKYLVMGNKKKTGGGASIATVTNNLMEMYKITPENISQNNKLKIEVIPTKEEFINKISNKNYGDKLTKEDTIIYHKLRTEKTHGGGKIPNTQTALNNLT
jgi:hypothetical protein